MNLKLNSRIKMVVAKAPLDIRHIEGTHIWEHLTDYWVTFNDDIKFIVPTGSRTDLMSIPWYLRWVYSKSGPGSDASGFHDRMCELKASCGFTSEEAHYAFYIIMLYCGVNETEAKLKYLAVRKGGPKWTL